MADFIIHGEVKIPHDRKKKFTPNVVITLEDFQKCVDFAKDMAYGGNHQSMSFGGNSHDRSSKDIFINALQGKLAEVGFYNFYTQKGKTNMPEPDFGVWERGVWEDCDMEIGDKKISIKSTKHFGQLLLLEKDRYSDDGLYLEPAEGGKPVKHDLIYLVRIKGVKSSDPSSYTDHRSIQIEITGYITHQDFLDIIKNNTIFPKGVKLGIPMIVDNYYMLASQLNQP